MDGSGVFHKVPLIDDSRLEELFCQELLLEAAVPAGYFPDPSAEHVA
jgi:hypothetical protein